LSAGTRSRLVHDDEYHEKEGHQCGFNHCYGGMRKEDLVSKPCPEVDETSTKTMALYLHCKVETGSMFFPFFSKTNVY
jgi:hypothetical protein